jgi:hypothetical protein
VVVDGGDPRAASGASAAVWQELQRADARPRLAAHHAVAAARAAGRWTRHAPEMRLELRIAPRGGRGERWRRSARAHAASRRTFVCASIEWFVAVVCVDEDSVCTITFCDYACATTACAMTTRATRRISWGGAPLLADV